MTHHRYTVHSTQYTHAGLTLQLRVGCVPAADPVRLGRWAQATASTAAGARGEPRWMQGTAGEGVWQVTLLGLSQPAAISHCTLC